MNKTRQIIVIMVALAVVLAGIWFWAFFRPWTVRMENQRIATAERAERIATDYREAGNRRRMYTEMTSTYNELRERWEIAAAALPDTFDDVAVLRHIQEVIYPHAPTVDLTFAPSVQRADDLLYSTTVNLSFETSYWQFLSVLYNLVQGDLGNRVVVYSLDVSPMEESEFVTMRGSDEVTRAAAYIPPHIRPEFVPGAEINPIGLHRFGVNMTVEYLSIFPGLN